MKQMKTYEEFSDAITGFRTMILLGAAVRLDLAERIEAGARDVAALARVCRVRPEALEIFLHALCAIGFLAKSKKDGRFSNSPAAKRYLLRGSPDYAGPKLAHSIESTLAWTAISEALKTGHSPRAGGSLASPEATERFIRAMDLNARETAPAVVAACTLPRGASTLLDLGGGPGTYALEFVRRHPGLRAAVFDLPQTLRVTRKILREKAIPAAAIRLISGDYMKNDLGGTYDVVFLSHILHSLSPRDSLKLLARARKALRPGGAIFIQDFLLAPAKDSPLYAALFGVHMLVNTSGGCTYSGEEIRDLLLEAGYCAPRIRRNITPTTGIVSARNPE